MRRENSQTTLILTATQARRIAAEAAAGYPDEICGFLVGVAAGAGKTVTRLIPIANDWEMSGSAFNDVSADFAAGSRRRRFAIPPDEFYRADRAARAAGEDILGFYHSHPDNPAIPSEYDLMLAQGTFPGYSYVIVSVAKGEKDAKDGRAAELTAWVLTEDAAAFVEETILADDGHFIAGVDRILWEIWDPVGVNDTPAARNEYRSYAPPLAALLRRDAPDAEILHFLEITERKTMGLSGSRREHLRAVIAHLQRFAEGE